MKSIGNRYLYVILVPAIFALWFSGCDTRPSISPQAQHAFSGDINVVRDYSARRTIAQFSFYRDGDSLANAEVHLNDISLTENVGGIYYLEAPLTAVFDGLNTVEFVNLRDNYNSSIAIHMPDSFGVAVINPRHNSGVADVFVQWSQPEYAATVLLVVIARNYPSNGSIPYMALLEADVTNRTIPYTTFEDSIGFAIRDIYYVYLAAFNQGFGEYDGIQFPLPENLPKRRISNPSGYATYGTIAPVDSIMVLP
jgi:hypothetical protein